MIQKKKSHIALFLFAVMLLTALLTALPVSAAETTEEGTNYDSYYAYANDESVTKIFWDAFDRQAGDEPTEYDKTLFGTAGTFGEGYLSVSGTTLNFSDAFANDGKTDYTLDLTVAMQNSTTGNFNLGALSSFSVQAKTGIGTSDGHPVDASYGIISHTYVGYNNPNGSRVQIATDTGWSKAHFVGKPLGQVYSFGVSTDYTVGDDGTGTAVLTIWRDGASPKNPYTLAYPVTVYGTTASRDTTVFKIPNTSNFDYYALRYYDRVLTAEELQQNHFVDLAKWFGISLDVYDTYDAETRTALHAALREETFDTITKAALQSTVDGFASFESALDIEDYIAFDGFSAALYDAPGLRSIYRVDRTAIASLEKAGYNVTVGALVAVENGRDIADITLDTQSQVIACEVYKNGTLTGSVLEDEKDHFLFALTTRYDSEASHAYFEESLLYRAFMTVEKDGTSETYYLDADGDTFGHSVTVEKVSLLLAFLGHTDSVPIKQVLGDEIIALASASYADYAPIFATRADGERLAKDVSDYLFASYKLRADIMTNTGIKSDVYTYANASSYYKLFTTDHQERNVAGYDTLALLLACEHAATTVNYAADMASKLYEDILAVQTLYGTASSVLTAIEENAATAGIDAEKAAWIADFLASCIAAHEMALSDSVRDISVVNTNMATVKGTLTDPTTALAALRAKLFTVNDLPAFGTDTPLSSYVILTDEQNEESALMLSSILSGKYGVFVPYYPSFPETAEYAHTISLFDASNTDAAELLGDNDYLLSMQGTNALLCGKTTSDAQLAAVVFTRSLTDSALTLTESVGRDIPDLFTTDLPTYLQALTVKTVEDGGVMDRFNQVLLEMPDEYAVVEPLSSADYALSTANTVYVSPDGNDNARGTYYAPFKTLERAFSYALGKGGAQILLFGGTYKIDGALTLSAMHSGSKQSPLYISAMPGEEVLFTTADTVYGKDFTPVTDESIIARLDSFTENNHENVYVADLASLGITNYGKTTTSGEPLFVLDGVQYNLARYPNKGETLTPLLTVDCILKQSQVTTGSSYLYVTNNKNLETTAGWKLRIDEESAYRDRLEKWTWTDGTNTAESIWMYGALYEEWHREHYPLVITNEVVDTTTGETDITMSSTKNCGWGIYDKLTSNTATARNSRNGYFYNILEELDADGEWYLDHSTGMLYVYSSTGIADSARATIVSDTHNILTISGASNIVLNGIEFAETLGRCLLITGSENILVQNCTFRDTRASACTIEKSYNSGVIASDFSRTATTMLSIAGTNDRTTMTPDRIFVQNCYFHDPIVQTAISLTGISCLVSHNLFEHTTISFTGAECILEYNDFDSGSQITNDSGPIYCSGPSGPKGNHIRYNYLYDLNFSHYGIYIDDLSSDNYIYSNVVVNANGNSGSKCVNLHNGHQNVVYNNVLVNATDAGIRDNANYYVKYVYDVKYKNETTKVAISSDRIRYYTATDGTQSTSTNTESGGGLGYRWDSLMTSALSSFDNYGGSNERYAERFPNLALYMELTRTHLAASKADENYAWNTAYVAWDFTVNQETTYAWGDESLYDFLMARKDTQDIEVYLRSPAYNEYVGNVFLGCATDIYSYTPWGMGLQTTNVQDNYGYPATSEYFTQAMNGDLSAITQASTWQETVPGFETIPYEKFGQTVLGEVDLFCPIVVAAEDLDHNLSFDELFGN